MNLAKMLGLSPLALILICLGILALITIYLVVTTMINKKRVPMDAIKSAMASFYRSNLYNSGGYLYLTRSELVFLTRFGKKIPISINQIAKANDSSSMPNHLNILLVNEDLKEYVVKNPEIWAKEINKLKGVE